MMNIDFIIDLQEMKIRQLHSDVNDLNRNNVLKIVFFFLDFVTLNLFSLFRILL